MNVSKALIKEVKKAIRFSYSPYSHISVGAGLYCGKGKIYTGTNIENSSYSLSICAERVALFKAICGGEKKFLLMLLYSPQIDFITPCGACLQVLNEFAPDLIVVTMNSNDEFRFLPLKTLLPTGKIFSQSSLFPRCI
jgi:cytidine deaminase